MREAESGFFDLYLLEYSLPDGKGLELAAVIRQFDEFTPILFITSPRTLVPRQVAEVGAQGTVTKDDLPDDLRRRVSDIFGVS